MKSGVTIMNCLLVMLLIVSVRVTEQKLTRDEVNQFEKNGKLIFVIRERYLTFV